MHEDARSEFDFVGAIDEALESRTLRAGDTLCRAGDEADGVAIVHRGRLAVLDDAGRTVGVLGRHDVFGEIGALTRGVRTRTVVATRDTELRVLPQAGFEQLLIARPEIGRELSRLVVERLVAAAAEHTTRVPSTIAIVSADESVDVGPLVGGFTRSALAVAVLARPEMAGRTEPELMEWLDRAERDHDVTLLLAGSVTTNTDWAIRQADDVLVVAQARSDPGRVAALGAFVDGLALRHGVMELVLVNRRGAVFPVDGTAWRAAVEPDRLHHVRADDDASVDRMVRLITGTARGLVLSGGGAKGLAHIGVWRAIEELGVEIDAVSGVSFGALMAAGIALDYTADQLHEMVAERLVNNRGIFDPTFPFTSVLRGAGVSNELEDVGDGRTFDQVWRPFLCSSCDLTTGELVDHDRGPLWQAVRASLSIPGVFPPVRKGGRLLVDGAVRDNLPIQSLRNAHPTPLEVVAVDVGKDSGLAPRGTPEDGAVSGWAQLRRQLQPGRAPNVPNLGQVMLRVIELAGTDAPAAADVLIKPDLAGLGLMDLSRIDAYERAGHAAAVAALG